jgi:hypothetical protein
MSVLLQLANATITSQKTGLEELSELVDALMAFLNRHELLPDLDDDLKQTLETHGFMATVPEHGD